MVAFLLTKILFSLQLLVSDVPSLLILLDQFPEGVHTTSKLVREYAA